MSMKKLIILFAITFGISGCEIRPIHSNHSHGVYVDVVPEPFYCGYDNLPYEHAPVSYHGDPWTYDGECYTWVVADFYGECYEQWCYSEQSCGWDMDHYTCYPI